VLVEGADAFAEEVMRAGALATPTLQGKRPRDAAAGCSSWCGGGWGAAEVAFGSKTGASAAKWRKEIGDAPEEADRGWLQELSAWALAQNVAAPPTIWRCWSGRLERGLPPKTHLILWRNRSPQSHALVRLEQEKGAHVKRRAERRGRPSTPLDISPLVSDELGPLKKKLARDAEAELKNRLGDDLRLIASSCATRAPRGERAQITPEDVEAVVAPVREEESSRWRKR